MKIINFLRIAGIIINLNFACNPENDNEDDIASCYAGQENSNAITYQITFNATWTSETHPHEEFPSDPHFSPIYAMSHTEEHVVWAVGKQVDVGIKQIAETGQTSLLEEKTLELQKSSKVCDAAKGMRVNSPGSDSVTIEVSKVYPLVTVVTMIAPSPDWFLSATSGSLFDTDTGEWKESVTIDLLPYDAGTDSGESFTSDDFPTDPQGVAAFLDNPRIDSETPLGSFVFTKI